MSSAWLMFFSCMAVASRSRMPKKLVREPVARIRMSYSKAPWSVYTSFLSASTAVTFAMRKATLDMGPTVRRKGCAMLSALRLAVATWYSSGWKQWWFCRSSSSTLYGCPLRPCTSSSPAKPPPTTTTLGWGRLS